MPVNRIRGRALQAARARILRRDNYLCAHCLLAGRVIEAVQVDHIIPLFRGGPDDDDNKQSLCHACHADKTARDMGKRLKPRIGLDGVPMSKSHHWHKKT